MSLKAFRGKQSPPLSRISRLEFLDAGEEATARRWMASVKEMTPAQYRSYLSALSQSQQQMLAQVAYSLGWKDSQNSIECFAKYVTTKDEHAVAGKEEAPFPTREQKPYLWEIIDTLQLYPLLACEKSRQLMVTWAVCIYALWLAKFRKNKIIFIQSKKEEDAANLVFNTEASAARISFMETHLPEAMRSVVFWSYGKGVFDTGSWIWGIPEGGAQIRSYTVSLLFSDEFAFQPDAEAAWMAAKASVGSSSGQVILVSTANPGAYMQELIRTL